MNYWGLATDENETGITACTLDNTLLRKINVRGAHPPTRRQAFYEVFSGLPILQILEGTNTLVHEDQALPDVFTFSGLITIFSKVAKELIVSMGIRNEDFLACCFTINQGQTFFMFLPEDSYDVVDAEKSSFLHRVPNPDGDPLLMFMESLVFKKGVNPESLPTLFCALMPGHSQNLIELFANDILKQAWEGSGLTGANFVKLQ